MEVGRARTSQVADRCRREVRCIGDVRARWVELHNRRTCVVGWMLLRALACVVYTKMENNRFKVNPNSRDVVKNQNQRLTQKIYMYINRVHK